MKVTVTINRGKGLNESFEGKVIAESTTHFKVTHQFNKDIGEWFAKSSPYVNCLLH